MKNELFERELQNTLINDVSLADYVKEHYASKRSGKWIEQEGWDGDVYYECSLCGEPFCLIEGTPTDNMYNFCPNCGAKMESEDKK